MNSRETLKTSVRNLIRNASDKHLAKIAESVKGKSVVIGSRLRTNKSPERMKAVYEVLSYYIGSILDACGARRVDYRHIPMDRHLTNTYDIAIVCYYDTDLIAWHERSILESYARNCHKSFYYSNLVPCCSGFTRCFVSLEKYLNPKFYKSRRYKKPRDRNLRRAAFAGRGADPFLFRPKQEEFQVLVDASRGPISKGIIKASRQLYEALDSAGIKINALGFNPENKSATSRVRLTRVAELYNRSYVYISGISGLYELPVIESQCAGNHVISYQGALHKELLCPETSSVCETPEDVVNRVLKIKRNFNPRASRQFIKNNFSWVQVVKRMAKYF